MVYRRLKKIIKLPLSLVLQAFIFCVLHFNVLQAVYTVIFGTALGLIYLYLDSIWSVIAVYMAYNLTTVLINHVIGETEISIAALIIMAVVGLIVSVAIMVVCCKERKKLSFKQ